MVFECAKTCVIHASEMVARYEKARVIELLRECLDFEELSAIQFCPRNFVLPLRMPRIKRILCVLVR